MTSILRHRLTIRRKPGDTEQRNSRRKRLRYAVIVLVVLLVGFSAITARWFIWPPQGMPARVDAIVLLNGPSDLNRLEEALELARERRASFLVISYSPEGPHWWTGGSACAPEVTEAKVICFIPNPDTTRGEAEFVGRMARQYHWHSIVLVATAPQDPVALLRTRRCFSGDIYMINASFPGSGWPSQVAYYWGAALKAFFLQRSC
jgi:uncharacterized SAM-binding protein YcdF (DUF218 family)